MSFYTYGFDVCLINNSVAKAIFISNEIEVDIDALHIDLMEDLYELTPVLEDYKLEVLVCK